MAILKFKGGSFSQNNRFFDSFFIFVDASIQVLTPETISEDKPQNTKATFFRAALSLIFKSAEVGIGLFHLLAKFLYLMEINWASKMEIEELSKHQYYDNKVV
mgnify:CR=1 FL=1